MTASSGRHSVLGVIVAVLGGFMAFCAGGAMLAFRSMANQYPELHETGPWPRAGSAMPGPFGEIIRLLSHHFWAAALIQLAVGLVLLPVGLLLTRNRTRTTA